MGANSKISWTDHTFNPWWGCVNVSPACDNCYAESFSKRYGNELWGVGSPRRFFGDKHWNQPFKWDREAFLVFGRPARVFCASMADVFEDRAELNPWRYKLGCLIAATRNLRWNLLTKRERVMAQHYSHWLQMPNVRFGVTVESQTYDFRIVPGVTWLSVEPMLGPLDITKPDGPIYKRLPTDALPGLLLTEGMARRKDGVSWIIIGGESGHNAREMKLEWALNLIQQCKSAGVAVHFKQTGDVLARKLGLKDRSGKDPQEWPAKLQIQEFPK